MNLQILTKILGNHLQISYICVLTNTYNMGNLKRKYQVNQEYFKNLDSSEKAYVLGFLHADGNVCENYVKFGQVIINKDIVEKVNIALNSNYPIRELQPKNGNLFYEVSFHSVTMCKDLEKLGIVPNKSLILEFPTFISDLLMPHFIRGYFDGDGCIWDGKPKKMMVKNEKKPGTMREKLVHNVKFTFTGNCNFINSLQDYLVRILGFKKTKLNFSKAKETKHICTMEYSGRGQVKRLYDYMYSNATIFGNTKKLKFENIICALDEKSFIETVLTEETPEMVIVSQASQSL